MVYIAKNMSEYQMKRKKAIAHLNEQAKHLDLIKKMVKQQKESGTPLFEGYKPQDGLESLLDASKVDENLEKKLVGIGARVSVAKQWIQSLESPIKEYVLDRFPFFAKIFEKNYGIVSINNLNATFRLFNQQMMEQQKVVKKPSRESIMKILEAANPEIKQRFITDLIQSNKNVEKWFNRLPLGSRPSVTEVLNEFFNAFSNEMDAFAAISYVGSKLGLNFPTVEVTSGDGDDSVFTSSDSYTTQDSPSWSPSESSSFRSTDFSTPSSSMGPTTFLNPFGSADSMSTISDITSDENNRDLSVFYPNSGSSRSQQGALDYLPSITGSSRDMSDYGENMRIGAAEEDQSQAADESQASFFDESDELSYFTTIDPNDNSAIKKVAELYSEKDLMYFFDVTAIASMLYPGKKMSYGQAMAAIKRMTKETKVRRLAELGFNFDTESFP